MVFAIGAGHHAARDEGLPVVGAGDRDRLWRDLCGFGLYLWWQRRRGEQGPEVSDSLRRRLDLPLGSLFGFGVILVILQSLLDVVFIVAMVNVGAKNLPCSRSWVAVLCLRDRSFGRADRHRRGLRWAGPERRHGSPTR